MQDISAPLGAHVNVPPLLRSNPQMASEDVILTNTIKGTCGKSHRKSKEFSYLQNVLPTTMWDMINQVVYVYCILTNFGLPLVA